MIDIVYPLFISLSFIATIHQHQFHIYPFSKSKNNIPCGGNLGQKLPFKMKFMLYSSSLKPPKKGMYGFSRLITFLTHQCLISFFELYRNTLRTWFFYDTSTRFSYTVRIEGKLKRSLVSRIRIFSLVFKTYNQGGTQEYPFFSR